MKEVERKTGGEGVEERMKENKKGDIKAGESMSERDSSNATFPAGML